MFALETGADFQEAIEHFGAFGAAGGQLRIGLLVHVLEAVKFVGDVQRSEDCYFQRIDGQSSGRDLAHATVDGVDWYWPADETPDTAAPLDGVRLLAPFDPVVWDRRRFELLWGWAYRFEAYTPVKQRKLGYYALPLLWGDRVIGWTNISSSNGMLQAASGYVTGERPRGHAFIKALDVELDRLREFLT